MDTPLEQDSRSLPGPPDSSPNPSPPASHLSGPASLGVLPAQHTRAGVSGFCRRQPFPHPRSELNENQDESWAHDASGDEGVGSSRVDTRAERPLGSPQWGAPEGEPCPATWGAGIYNSCRQNASCTRATLKTQPHATVHHTCLLAAPQVSGEGRLFGPGGGVCCLPVGPREGHPRPALLGEWFSWGLAALQWPALSQEGSQEVPASWPPSH